MCIRVVCVSVLVFFLFAIVEILIDLIDARCVSYSKFESSSFCRLQKTGTLMHLCSSVARWMISSAGLQRSLAFSTALQCRVLKGVLNSARKGGLPSRLDKNNNACIDNPMEAGL
jgi:hypothetical protein